MHERATHSLADTLDGQQAVRAGAPARAGRSAIDGAGAHDGADLRKVLHAIAARIDVVLDERAAAGDEPEGRHRAARAWSSVVGHRATDARSELRRQALATTVLRMSADGRLGDDDRSGGAIDDAAESQDASERPSGADRSDARPVEMATLPVGEVAKPESGEVVSLRDTTTEPAVPTATDRSDVEDRLRAVRERLTARRVNATAPVDAPGARSPRVRRPSWRPAEMRSLVQRLLIGMAIVGASAVVSILAT